MSLIGSLISGAAMAHRQPWSHASTMSSHIVYASGLIYGRNIKLAHGEEDEEKEEEEKKEKEEDEEEEEGN
ncbi:hypothetical protein E2C01_003521 [Portunus trituberculatus]|uniref:Uncharacterized protein n=1 Tax=Portunus trituberculatus TaxID=210409 RepID=A0A5B7CMM5_PORTR|nr:hypothetical protein [Portunus trituberculatus]